MKKKINAILISFSLITTPLMQAAQEPQRFKDKPALSLWEKVTRLDRKVFGFLLGMPTGIATGIYASKYIPLPSFVKQNITESFVPSGNIEKINKKRGLIEFAEELVQVNVYGYLGIAMGSILFYKLLRSLNTARLARKYHVSYRMGTICMYYNINIDQYRSILTAAEQHQKEGLLAAINELYPKRFGADWQERMKTLFALYPKGDWRDRINALFTPYKTLAPTLIAKGSFARRLSEDERDFVRMVELGAAMANLYYGTKPDRKKALDEAMKLYQELGFLS